ncbi:AEC family transporter [Glaciecola sp. 1036]|uniref:AEC family transporter n=1 Tax=Alteromonadaceae TaxID=72275 RepID=UPI003D0219CA
MDSLQAFLDFAIGVIGPVVVLLSFGYGLFRTGLLTDDFVERGSRLIFNFALPALLFINISQADLNSLIDPKSVAIGISGTLLVFVVSFVMVSVGVKEVADKGVLVQGIFRSNMGIIGLAYCAKAYGPEGLAYGSVYMGCLTIVYNILSVAVLNIFQNQQTNFIKILKGIASNPIILSIIAGLIFSVLHIPLPQIAHNSLSYFAQLTLPLALLCTGAALRFSSLGEHWRLPLVGIMGKCFIYPLVIIFLAIQFGISGMPLGVIFLMAMSPTAAASYIMVRKIGGNHQLAAQIIALSTVVSLPVTVIGYWIMLQVSNIN